MKFEWLHREICNNVLYKLLIASNQKLLFGYAINDATNSLLPSAQLAVEIIDTKEYILPSHVSLSTTCGRYQASQSIAPVNIKTSSRESFVESYHQLTVNFFSWVPNCGGGVTDIFGCKAIRESHMIAIFLTIQPKWGACCSGLSVRVPSRTS